MDACTFLAFAGFFVAQATGSFVVAGSELFSANADFGFKVLAIPVFIVAGMVATVVVRAAGDRRRAALAIALGLEAALLAGLTIASVLGGPGAHLPRRRLCLASPPWALQSATVRLLLANYASTNVMTSNTTQLAIEIVDSVRGAKSTSKLVETGSIMLGFLAGIAGGAFAYGAFGLPCLGLAIIALRAPRRERNPARDVRPRDQPRSI